MALRLRTARFRHARSRRGAQSREAPCLIHRAFKRNSVDHQRSSVRRGRDDAGHFEALRGRAEECDHHALATDGLGLTTHITSSVYIP
jgi:hypothetical protein